MMPLVSTTMDIISSWTPGIEPLVKGGKVQRGYIRGPCSSERRDLQGERLFQDGMDFTPFLGGIAKGEVVDGLTPGAVSVEHPVGVFTMVGEPVDLEKGELHDGVKCHVLTTKLMLDAGNELAEATWNQVEMLRMAKSRVKLGYSVEGGAKLRASYDKTSPLYKDVLESVIPNVVITARPRNRDAMFDAVVASLKATPDGGAALRDALNSLRPDLLLSVNPTRVVEGKAAALVAAADKLGLDASDLAVASVIRKSDPQAWNRALSRLLKNVAALAAT